jgi:hypothetical protein
MPKHREWHIYSYYALQMKIDLQWNNRFYRYVGNGGFVTEFRVDDFSEYNIFCTVFAVSV